MALSTSSSTMPVQLVSRASSLRYSSAGSPTIEALSRSGRSLVTTVTWLPSAARLRATARMRWSLVSPASDGGRAPRSWWLISTRRVPPDLVDRDRRHEVPVLHPVVLELAQGLAGRPAQLGVVALRLQLQQHHDREHHRVLVEAHQRLRVGQQHRGVEDVHPRSPDPARRRPRRGRGGGAERARRHCRRDGHGSPTRSGTSRKTTAQDRPTRGRPNADEAAPWSGTGTGSGAG